MVTDSRLRRVSGERHSERLMGEMNVGDTFTMPDLIAAWREDLRSGDRDAVAVERSRVAQSAFSIDLETDPPELDHTWMPSWVTERDEFNADRLDQRRLLARLAREWVALPAHADPFEGMLEAPIVIGALWAQHASNGRKPTTELMVTELVGTLWNIDPTSTALVTTSALYGTGPAARIAKTVPPDDEPITCPRCGWTGLVEDTYMEYFSELSHRECPRCEKMLLILPYEA